MYKHDLYQVIILENLENFEAKRLKTLGGMKRKLSMGIALCGRSKHLILDEPSSGIDVRARRELWSILQKYRKERTMLISTHYMDEAEALADRIVIIGKERSKFTHLVGKSNDRFNFDLCKGRTEMRRISDVFEK